MKAYIQTLRSFSHDVRMYLLTSALIGVSYFGFIAVLLNLYLLRLGYGPEFIGLVNGTTALAFALCSLPAGALGTRWGSRRLVILGVGLIMAGIFLLTLAEFLPAAFRPTWIVGSRLVSGVGFAFYSVNASPFLIAATQPQERDHAFSMQVALFPLAGFSGSLIAGMLPTLFATQWGLSLQQPAPFRYTLMLGAVVILPAVLALMTTRDVEGGPHASSPAQTKGALPLTLMLVMALVAMLRMGGESAARSFFNVYLDAGLSISTARIGALVAASQIIAGPTAMTAPLVISRRGKFPTIVSGTMGIAGGLLLLALFPHWAGASLGFMGAIAMLSLTRAVTNVYQMEIVTPEWRAAMAGVTSMAMGVGYSSMAMGGGYLITWIGYRGLFLTGAISTLGSALLFWFYFRVPRGELANSYGKAC